MIFFAIVGIIFVFSFILAARSMKDFGTPREIHSLIATRKMRGTIVFFKGKNVKHYSSSSDSSSAGN